MSINVPHWIHEAQEAANPVIACTSVLLAAWGLIQIFQTKLSNRRQLRAYLTIESVRLEPIGIGNKRVMVRFKNSGQTPASEIRFFGGSFLSEKELHNSRKLPPPVAPPPVQDECWVFENMGSGDAKEFDFFPYRMGDEPKTRRPEQGILYLYGKIMYKDIFKKKRETNFCYMQDVHSGGIWRNDVLRVCDIGNEAN